MPLIIPVDAHCISLKVSTFRVQQVPVQVGRVTQVQTRRVEDVQLIAPRVTEAAVRRGFELANQIWLPADICFVLRSFSPASTAAPNNVEVVDDAGFFFLARQFPPKSAVSLLLVNQFKSSHLGGMSAEPLTAAIIPSLGDPTFGRVLAHELGHLLGLPQASACPTWHGSFPGLFAFVAATFRSPSWFFVIPLVPFTPLFVPCTSSRLMFLLLCVFASLLPICYCARRKEIPMSVNKVAIRQGSSSRRSAATRALSSPRSSSLGGMYVR